MTPEQARPLAEYITNEARKVGANSWKAEVFLEWLERHLIVWGHRELLRKIETVVQNQEKLMLDFTQFNVALAGLRDLVTQQNLKIAVLSQDVGGFVTGFNQFKVDFAKVSADTVQLLIAIKNSGTGDESTQAALDQATSGLKSLSDLVSSVDPSTLDDQVKALDTGSLDQAAKDLDVQVQAATPPPPPPSPPANVTPPADNPPATS